MNIDPNLFHDILLGFGWIVSACVAAFTIFGKGITVRRAQSDKIADELIKRLQQKVDQLSDDINVLRQQVDTQRSELDHTKGRNAMLEELFKGRDPGMQAFLKDAPSLLEIARQNNGLAKETSQGLANLERTLATFIENIQPLIPKRQNV